MLRKTSLLLNAFSNLARQFSTTQTNRKRVCIIGSNGNVGRTLSVILKRNERVTALSLYDLKGGVGQALDVSHIDTQSLVLGFEKAEDLSKALYCADIVIVVAGSPSKKDQKEDDLFKENSKIITETMPKIAEVCPKALIAIVTNPINSLVPLAAEELKKTKKYDPNRLFGVTTPHVVRARTIVADILQCDSARVNIPVIGGGAMCTVLPVPSQCKPRIKIEDEEDILQVVRRVREAEDEVMKVKGSAATLMVAHAVAKFTNALVMGLSGLGDPIECSYVESQVTECAFFATPLKLGKEGIEKNLGLPDLSQFEAQLMQEMIPELKESIKKGMGGGK